MPTNPSTSTLDAKTFSTFAEQFKSNWDGDYQKALSGATSPQASLGQTTGYMQTYQPYQPAKCPSCGYCKSCGRSNQTYYPYYGSPYYYNTNMPFQTGNTLVSSQGTASA